MLSGLLNETGEKEAVGFLDRIRHPGGLHVTTCQLETFCAPAKSSGESISERLSHLGHPLVNTRYEVHQKGIPIEQLMTLIIPGVVEHSLYRLSSPMFERALTMIEACIEAPPVQAMKAPDDWELWVTTRVELFFGRRPYVQVWPRFEKSKPFAAPVLVPDTAVAFLENQYPLLSEVQKQNIIERLGFGLKQWCKARPHARKPTWDWAEWIDYPYWIRALTGSYEIHGYKPLWGYYRYTNRKWGFALDVMDHIRPVEGEDETGIRIDFRLQDLGTPFMVTVGDLREVAGRRRLTAAQALKTQFQDMKQAFSKRGVDLRPLSEIEGIQVGKLPAAKAEFLLSPYDPVDQLLLEVFVMRGPSLWYRLTWFYPVDSAGCWREISTYMLSTFEFLPPDITLISHLDSLFESGQ